MWLLCEDGDYDWHQWDAIYVSDNFEKLQTEADRLNQEHYDRMLQNHIENGGPEPLKLDDSRRMGLNKYYVREVEVFK